MIHSLYQVDVHWFKEINLGPHNSFLDLLFLSLSVLGLGGGQVVILLIGCISPVGRKLFWPCIWALFWGGLVVADGLKNTVPRDRPSQLAFAHPYEHIYYGSFPSGQTAAPIAVAVMLILLLRRTRYAWIGWAYFVFGLACGYSRLYRGMHYPSDVIGGVAAGALGASITYLLYAWRGILPVIEEIRSVPKNS